MNNDAPRDPLNATAAAMMAASARRLAERAEFVMNPTPCDRTIKRSHKHSVRRKALR